MALGLWPSLCQTGLAAARPTQPSEAPAGTFILYFASDTQTLSIWNPATNAWIVVNGALGPASNIASAGSTQLGATPITTLFAAVTTATASSKGVLLPVAVTGMEVEIYNKGPTFATKVYPNTHGKINAGSSNAADGTVLSALKTTVYHALDAVNWVTMRGA